RDWSSDVCSSDLAEPVLRAQAQLDAECLQVAGLRDQVPAQRDPAIQHRHRALAMRLVEQVRRQAVVVCLRSDLAAAEQQAAAQGTIEIEAAAERQTAVGADARTEAAERHLVQGD